MKNINSIRLGDIYLVRKSKKEIVLAESDRYDKSLVEIVATEDNLFRKNKIHPKHKDKSFSLFKVSYIIDKGDISHGVYKIENVLITPQVIYDWQTKLKSPELQNLIDVYLGYLKFNDNIRISTKVSIIKKLLNSLSLEEFIVSFNQNDGWLYMYKLLEIEISFVSYIVTKFTNNSFFW